MVNRTFTTQGRAVNVGGLFAKIPVHLCPRLFGVVVSIRVSKIT
ncbi:hypothetical protein [Microbispora sp. CA-102843]